MLLPLVMNNTDATINPEKNNTYSFTCGYPNSDWGNYLCFF